jgi:hypothetical protein
MVHCKKDPVVVSITGYNLTVRNEYGPLEAHFGLYLSDSDGKVVAFRWLNSGDTTNIRVPNVPDGTKYDCTLAKITTLQGAGVQDSTISLTTYTRVGSGETIQLRDQNYYRSTMLRIQFTNVQSFDSIIVPNALTFQRPQASNNFTGQYNVSHTGQFWLRILINGDPHWRILQFDHINNQDLQAVVDASLLSVSFAPPTPVGFPFSAQWHFSVEGVVSLDSLLFYPLGDLIRAPGGYVPSYHSFNVFQPILSDVFNSMPDIYHGFRLRVSGLSPTADGYFYESDGFYPTLPSSLPVPAFDAVNSGLTNNVFSAATCTGDVDVVAFVRSRTGNPALNWELFLEPAVNDVTKYRLPELPKALASLSVALGHYDFNNQAQLRAESYDKLKGYSEVLHQRFLNNDPVWQARAGYLAKGR